MGAMMDVTRAIGALALATTVGMLATSGAEAQQTQSRLYEVTKSKKLRVCQFPLYYSISFRNSKTGEIEGIDADLAKEFAKELDAKLEIVESSFGSFIADLQAGKCEIGMFGVGATMKRGQAVEFSKPYLLTNLYAVTRKDSKIKEWNQAIWWPLAALPLLLLAVAWPAWQAWRRRQSQRAVQGAAQTQSLGSILVGGRCG